MDNPSFTHIQHPDDPAWEQVEGLLQAMYVSLETQGWKFPLTVEGARLWLKTVRNTAGKFGVMVVAKDNGRVVGFAHGMVKFLPDYLGGNPIGFVTHIFVEEDYRVTGTGKQLVEMLEEWFCQKKVHSVELQVITGNAGGIEFWTKLGYREELRQYRKKL